MKTLMNITSAFLILFSISAIAQQSINYKALIKDGGSNVVANQSITIQFQILQGVAQTNVYQETHTPTTDANGFVILNIGEGSVNSGDYSTIDWGSDDHYLNVQINTGAGLTDMGTTQFMAVPYALSAANAATKINELSDGKSDADGKSLFLGVNAGLNDDGSTNWNVGIGFNTLYFNTEGKNNTATGHFALYLNNGIRNTANGSSALNYNTTGNYNTATGYAALVSNTTGGYNTAIGYYALELNTEGHANTAIGNYAGSSNFGNYNVFIGNRSGFYESASNKLYIENSDANSDNALIYGEFGTDNTATGNILRTNSEFQIGNPTVTGYAFPTVDGAANQVLETDGSGSLSWTETAAIGPIAYGSISPTGSILSGSGNYSVEWNAANERYDITIANESYHFNSYTTVVTPSTWSVSQFFSGSASGKLTVELRDSSSARIQANFNFVTYK